MKKLFKSFLALALVSTVLSCSKDENLDVDLNNYNYDNYDSKPIDEYIYNNLTQPYNIEVVYRFDRSHTDINKNISPPDINKVAPAIDMIRDGFLKVYEKVAGPTFIKKYTFKQFVLFGSHAYNSNGTVTLGTADGGRRVVLYDINNLDPNQSENIKRRLRTVHHEFAHIVNQVVAIPTSFRIITTDHVADWTAAANTDAEALRLGFISQYARSSFGEDFAETVAHLLIEGQAYYDRRIAASSADGATKLRAKQAVVEEYFMQNFNINFKELQYEMFLALSEIYNDQTLTFYGRMTSNAVNNISIDLDNASHYKTFGVSNTLLTAWNAAKVGLAAYGNNGGRYPTIVNMVFPSSNLMQLQITYKNPANATATYNAYYDFTVANENGITKFTYVANASTDTAYGNGRTIKNSIQPFLDYFESNKFQSKWVSPDVVGYGNVMKFAGFYDVVDASNYIYGPVTLK